MTSTLEPQIENPSLIEHIADRVHSPNFIIVWMFFLYHMGKVKMSVGSKANYDYRFLPMAADNVGFAYVRFEENPVKFALITYNARRVDEDEVERFEKAKEEIKKLVGVIDFEIESEKPLLFQEIKWRADKEAPERDILNKWNIFNRQHG